MEKLNEWELEKFQAEEDRHKELLKSNKDIIRTVKGLVTAVESSDKVDLLPVSKAMEAMGNKVESSMKFFTESLTRELKSDNSGDREIVEAINHLSNNLEKKMDGVGDKVENLAEEVRNYNKPRQLEMDVSRDMMGKVTKVTGTTKIID